MRIKKSIENISYNDTKQFFNNRVSKYDDDNPYSVTMYQDKHPDLVSARNKAEMEKCGIFKKGAIDWNETFRKYYQLIRNAIKVGEKSFVVIITDERNRSTNKQLCDFEKEMLVNTKYRNHLICVTWQEICNNAKSGTTRNSGI